MTRSMKNALLLGLILACAGLVHHTATACTVDGDCTGTQYCDGTNCVDCDAGATDSCSDCSYTTTSNVYKCTECDEGYFGSEGTAAAITTCMDCYDNYYSGVYACEVCDGAFVDTTTDTVTCTRAWSNDGTDGSESSIDYDYTEVGWYALDGKTYPCNTFPGCRTCVNNEEPSVDNCYETFDGWSYEDENGDAGDAFVECADAYCTDCYSGTEDTWCSDWEEWDEQAWLWGTSKLIDIYEFSTYASNWEDYGQYTMTLECNWPEAFPELNLAGWCLPCTDPSLGIEGSSECEWDAQQGFLKATECADGYAELWWNDPDYQYEYYYDCISCGEGALYCDLDEDTLEVSNLGCDTDNGYEYVSDDDECVSWLDEDEFATSGSWSDDGTEWTSDGCPDGYYIDDDDRCAACLDDIDNVITCSYDGTDVTADTCDDGYFADGTDCTACPDNAVECSDADTATFCAQGYFVNDSDECEDAGDQFANCVDVATDGNGDPYYCNECAEGYGYDWEWWTCYACDDENAYDCLYTSADVETWSWDCQDGYYLVNGWCYALPEGCIDYYQQNEFRTQIACTECDDGYYLDYSTHFCLPCGTGIATCDVQGYQPWPTECESGYTWEAASYDGTTFTITFPKCSSGSSDGGDTTETTCASAANLAFSSIAVLVALFVALF